MAGTDRERGVRRRGLVSEYDPDWPTQCAHLARHFRAIAGPALEGIEHVGGTAVPGMIAKPILDIDLVVRPDRWTALVSALAAAGVRHVGDQGISGREVFKPLHRGAWPRVHLYACAPDSEELRRHLAFRDYLRTHPSAAAELGARKWSLADRDIETYQAGKAALVQAILARALLIKP